MDLDKYRSACGKLALVVFWATALSQLLNHWLSASELSLAVTLEDGGFAGLVVYFLLLLRRVSLIFSLTGVFSLFAVFAGLMRKQWRHRPGQGRVPGSGKAFFSCFLILLYRNYSLPGNSNYFPENAVSGQITDAL